MLCKYLYVKVVREDEQAMEEYVHSHGSSMIAQFPLSIVVRYCLVKGCTYGLVPVLALGNRPCHCIK